MDQGPPGGRRPLGFGVVAGLEPSLLVPLAVRVAELGYGSFWINDSGRPDADGLAGLAVVAAAAPGLELGVGVLPLDRRSPEAIAEELARLELPLDRLRLGIGSGGAPRPLGIVRDGVAAIRELVPGARGVHRRVGAADVRARRRDRGRRAVQLGRAAPARRRTPAWSKPGSARPAARPIERWSYVRCAVGPDASKRLGEEAARYATSPAYGRAFDAMGEPFERVGVAGAGHRPAARGYRAVLDGTVVRALPVDWRLDELPAIAEAVRRAAGVIAFGGRDHQTTRSTRDDIHPARPGRGRDASLRAPDRSRVPALRVPRGGRHPARGFADRRGRERRRRAARPRPGAAGIAPATS